jgi:hypothetical protein
MLADGKHPYGESWFRQRAGKLCESRDRPTAVHPSLRRQNSFGAGSKLRPAEKSKGGKNLSANSTWETTSPEFPKERRKTLFIRLETVLSLAHKKLHSENVPDRVKQGWARITVSAIGTYGDLLESIELDQLNERLSRLEEKDRITVMNK